VYKATDASGNVSRDTALVKVAPYWYREGQKEETTPAIALMDRVSVNAFPNPSAGSVTIAFNIPEDAQSRIAVYDNLGNIVAVLLDEFMTAGSYSRIWNAEGVNGNRVTNGVYYIRVTAGPRSESYPITIVK
jgi:flagellar hook assembly protein FlgD